MKWLSYSKHGAVVLIVLFFGLNSLLNSLARMLPMLMTLLIVGAILQMFIGRR